MKRKRQYKKRYKKVEGGFHTYNNRIYFGKKPQKGIGAISKVLGYLLWNVGDIIGL